MVPRLKLETDGHVTGGRWRVKFWARVTLRSDGGLTEEIDRYCLSDS